MRLSKLPDACETISEIRDAIDEIDKELIHLLGIRHQYMKEIVKFKSGAEGIIAKERKELVLQQRKAWAKESGMDPDLIGDIYKLLIEKNIQIQFEIYNNKDN